MSSAADASVAGRRPERVLVGVDGSLVSRTALRWAVEHARPGDTVVVAHVWKRSPAMVDAGVSEAADEPAAGALVRHEIAHVQALAHEAHIELESLVREGEAQAILGNIAADLLVVGACGRGQIVGRLLGSVSYHLARHCHTPLVIVPLRSARGIDPRPGS